MPKIYTRTGDKGQTGLATGARLAKHSLEIHNLGDVDELNCQLGVLAAYLDTPSIQAELSQIQALLFEIGAELATEKPTIKADDSLVLEQQIDSYQQQLPALTHFILPAGSVAISHCHLARAVCRRAERSLSQLASKKSINPFTQQYLNRLSDYLFVLARYIGKENHIEEQAWKMRP